MQFTIQQADLAGAVAKLRPYVAKGTTYSTSAETGVLFEAKGEEITLSSASQMGCILTVPGQVHKAGRVVLGLRGLDYLSKPQFTSQEITFKAKNKTLAPPYQGGKAIQGAECVAEVGGSRIHQDAVHASFFKDLGTFKAKEYRLAFTIDPLALAQALKRVSGYVSSESYRNINYLLVESLKRNQLTLVGSDGSALAVETVPCTTKDPVPRLALSPSMAKPIITALERFKAPATRVSLGRPEHQETRVSFEVDASKGEKWRVRYGDETLVFADPRIDWPDYQRLLASKGSKLVLPAKPLATALAALPSDAGEIVTLSQPRSKPAMFEWNHYQQKNRLAIDIPGLPIIKAMDVNRKLLARILKSFKGDQVVMVMPRDGVNPYRLTCAQDPALTICLAQVVRTAPRVVNAAPPVEPEIETEEQDAEAAA